MRRVALCLVLLAGTAARGEQRGYEDRLIDWALAETGRSLEPDPANKRIGEILVVREEIVAQADPYPQLVNLPHVKTRESVIRQELLFQVGEPWSPERALETERNLRSLGILALARVVPLRTGQPGTVDVLVVTKDLWSIRFNQQLSLVGNLLQLYRARPRESNLLGFGKTLSLDFIYRRDTLTFGEIYEDPRLFGLPLALAQSAAVSFNRGTDRAEGSRASLGIGRPIYSLAQTFSWVASASYSVQRVRLYSAERVLELPYPDEGSAGRVPFVYDARVFSGGANATWRGGETYKREGSLGAGAYSRDYHAPFVLPEAERRFLHRRLPRSEDAIYLYGAARLFEARFIVMRNVYTFALSEDVQLGPSFFVQARYASPLLGSPTHFVELGARARYRVHYSDNLSSLSASTSARYTPGGDPGFQRPWVDENFVVQAEHVTQALGPGRVVVRGLWWLRDDPLGVAFLQLGGDNGLRGTDAESLRGRNQLLLNLEYRTKPIEVRTLQLGLVFFYDVGSAYDSAPRPVHTLGLGLRALFPQFDVQTFRIDFGWAINGPQTSVIDRFSGGFGQVTDHRPASLDAPLD